MSKKNLDPKLVLLQEEIERVHSELKNYEPDSPEYAKVLKRLVVLHGLLPKKERLFSPDAILGLVSNLVLGGGILAFEKSHVITSKAFSWIKPLSTSTRSLGK